MQVVFFAYSIELRKIWMLHPYNILHYIHFTMFGYINDNNV